MKKQILLFFVLGFFPGIVLLYPLDLGLRGRGFGMFPLGQDRSEYLFGGGGSLLLDTDLASLFSNPWGLGYSAGLEAGFAAVPVFGSNEAIKFYDAGVSAGLSWYPLSRLNLRAEASGGLYRGFFGTGGSSSWWLRAGVETGFRFTPAFTLNAYGGYTHYDNKNGGAMYEGVYLGLSLQFNITIPPSESKLEVEIIQDDPVFPIFLPLYRESPIGRLRITNRESAEIRNIQVSFRAGNYTASEYRCAEVPVLYKGRTGDIFLYADFDRSLLNFTTSGRIVGETVIRYEILGSSRTITKTTAIQVYNRNNCLWADPLGLAAFVTPRSPEILRTAKYLTGISRSRLRTGLNMNLQFGIYLMEGLIAGGIRSAQNPETPYALREKREGVDTVQFPFETLNYRTGDVDDLGILYGALLEASGISAVFIPLEDDFIVAFSLDLSEAEARSHFNGTDRLLIMGDRVWIPLAFSTFDQGFINAWEEGIEKLSRAEAASLVDLAAAWAIYPPADLPIQEQRFSFPGEEDVFTRADVSMRRYIAQELRPKIQALSLQTGQDRTGEVFNRLGLLYIRSSSIDEARAALEKAAGLGYVPAMVNLGHLARSEKNNAAAVSWYRQALSLDPKNAAAARGLARIEQ
jgi:hypothetical protein